jgi:hypothetical protein
MFDVNKIPKDDAEFDAWVAKFREEILKKANKLGISPEVAAKLEAALAKWKDSYRVKIAADKESEKAFWTLLKVTPKCLLDKNIVFIKGYFLGCAMKACGNWDESCRAVQEDSKQPLDARPTDFIDGYNLGLKEGLSE